MAQPEIKYAIHKSSETGLFLLGFDNLTKTEAAEYLLLLARQQDARAEPVVDEGKLIADVERREVFGLAEGIILHGAPAGEGFKGAGDFGKKDGSSPTKGRKAITYAATLPDGTTVTKRSFHRLRKPTGYAYQTDGKWFLAAVNEPDLDRFAHYVQCDAQCRSSKGG